MGATIPLSSDAGKNASTAVTLIEVRAVIPATATVPGGGGTLIGKVPGQVLLVGMARASVAPPGAGLNVTPSEATLYDVDLSSGALNVNLPSAPYDGMRMGLKDSKGNARTSYNANNSLVALVLPAAGHTVEDPAALSRYSSIQVNGLQHNGGCVIWQFNSSASQWEVIHTTVGPGILNLAGTIGGALSVTLTGATVCRCDSSTNGINITMPPTPTDGMEVIVKDSNGNGSSSGHAINVFANSSVSTQRVENPGSLGNFGDGTGWIAITHNGQSMRYMWNDPKQHWEIIGAA